MKKVNFLGFECYVQKEQYSENDRVCLSLMEIGTDEPVATATTNLGREPLEKDEVIIKDYSENEGIYDALVEAGVISKAVRVVSTAGLSCKVCKLLI